MRSNWITRTVVGSLLAGSSVWAEDEIQVVAIPTTPGQERLSVLPDQKPVDLPPLLRPPTGDSNRVRTNESTPIRPGDPQKAALYDHRRNYLPETNPGERQPPCPCLPLGRRWFNASYFLGTTENDSIPPLVIGGGNGIPGSPGTVLLYGSQRLDHDFRSGLRMNTGLWLDRCQNWGLEGNFFFLESSNTGFQAASAGNIVLARPFGSGTGTALSDILAAPNLGSGSIRINTPLNFLGAEANTIRNLFCEDHVRLDFLLGYRFVRLMEAIEIQTQQQFLNGSQRGVLDSFQSNNHFHGGQIGISGEMRWNRWYLDATAKIAFGVNWQQQEIAGGSRLLFPGQAPLNGPAGLLTAPSNIGDFQETRFAVVPETNLALGYQVNDHLRAFIGYTFLYVSNVSRASEMIDPTILINQAGQLRPARQGGTSDFWMQGINLGLELRY